MKRARIIPALLLDNGDLVKTIRFKNKRYIGDPINAIKILNEKEVDELVLLDISATKNNREPDFKLIEDVASECFMPLAYGGGIRSIEHVQRLFKSGVEKIILNSVCFSNPDLIRTISNNFGKQSVTICIDVKKDVSGNPKVFRNSGKNNTGLDPVHFAIQMEELGAGELIINSIDRDGTYLGYDYNLIRKISNAVFIPVIALGGGGKISDLKKALEHGASAVSAGSLFTFYGKLKAVLINYPSRQELEEHVLNYQNSKEQELKILHITPWYPTKFNPKKALFIKENFDALNEYCKNYLFHFEINIKKKKQDGESYVISENEETVSLHFFFKIWRFIEIISFLKLIRVLFSRKIKKEYDIINLHIAYPLGVYIKFLELIFKKPIVISEHWTAYHYNFYVSKNSKGLNRIKNIFKHKTPIIVVSKALADDISNFSNQNGIRFHILPNIIDTNIFNCKNPTYPTNPTFFMLNMWSAIKQPFIGIDAFEQFLLKNPGAKLRIGGFGPIWAEIEQYVASKNLGNSIVLLGELTKNEIAKELDASSALLHTSKYETFSVISAESACCGVPVIALNLGGIPSFINSSNGYLHEDNSIKGWLNAMETFILNQHKFDKSGISLHATSQFSKSIIGKKYYKILKNEYRHFYAYSN